MNVCGWFLEHPSQRQSVYWLGNRRPRQTSTGIETNIGIFWLSLYDSGYLLIFIQLRSKQRVRLKALIDIPSKEMFLDRFHRPLVFLQIIWLCGRRQIICSLSMSFFLLQLFQNSYDCETWWLYWLLLCLQLTFLFCRNTLYVGGLLQLSSMALFRVYCSIWDGGVKMSRPSWSK